MITKKPMIILLVILGILTLFVVQNLSPALPLVFLGTTTITLPLSVWMVLAVIAGFLTVGLIRFSTDINRVVQGEGAGTPNPPRPQNPAVGASQARTLDHDIPAPPPSPSRYQSPAPAVNLEKEPESTWRRNTVIDADSVEVSPTDQSEFTDDWASSQETPEREVWDDDDWGETPITPEPAPTKLQDNMKTVIQDPENDWDKPSPSNSVDWDDQEDWIDGNSTEGVPGNGEPAEPDFDDDFPPAPPATYEIPQAPKTETWSGSIYSYSYRQEQDRNPSEEINEEFETSEITDEPPSEEPQRVIIPPLPSYPSPAPTPTPHEPKIKEDPEEEWI